MWVNLQPFFTRTFKILLKLKAKVDLMIPTYCTLYNRKLQPSFMTIFIADIDECASSDSNNCDVNALCTNTGGSYICRCKRGYEGDGLYCNGTYVISDPAVP